MPRPCGPCGDPRRNELDRRLLEKDLNGESFRRISADFGYSETALRRHLNEHLTLALSEVKQLKDTAKEQFKEEVKAKELGSLKDAVAEGEKAKLKASASLLDQLRDLREEGWQILENAKADPKLALGAIQRLAQLLELQAEIEGKIRAGKLTVAIGQTLNIYESPQWQEVGDLLSRILEPYPDVRAEVAKGFLMLAREGSEGT